MDEERLDAYDKGYNAYYEAGNIPPNNPFPVDSEKYLDWEDGWADAADECASEPF